MGDEDGRGGEGGGYRVDVGILWRCEWGLVVGEGLLYGVGEVGKMAS